MIVITEDSDNNVFDAETIPYAEPYRDTTKKTIHTDETLKKTLKILTKPLYNKESRSKLKRKTDKKLVEIIDNDDSDAETIPYAEPYRDTFTKNDEIYKKS